MADKKSISIFISSFLIVGILLLAAAENGYSGPPSNTFGSCCTTQAQGECIGCEFFGCAYSRSFCEQELGGDFEPGVGGVCVTEEGQTRCGDGDPEFTGCCVIEQGICEDEIIRGNCFDDQGEGAEFWVFQEACSSVPQCEPRERPIPTFSQWGLIALAVVLGIFGFIAVRRRIVAN